ncbi:MAG: nitroreductase family deazaflavin-dependent oxidoreductase, partial [Geodermatophilaceae bacterium]
MAYLKPPFFVAKVFNRIAMRTGIGGSETLTVTGRSTGKPQRIPVITLDHDGARYLVSARGESQWVRNVRANPTVTVAGKGATGSITRPRCRRRAVAPSSRRTASGRAKRSRRTGRNCQTPRITRCSYSSDRSRSAGPVHGG